MVTKPWKSLHSNNNRNHQSKWSFRTYLYFFGTQGDSPFHSTPQSPPLSLRLAINCQGPLYHKFHTWNTTSDCSHKVESTPKTEFCSLKFQLNFVMLISDFVVYHQKIRNQISRGRLGKIVRISDYWVWLGCFCAFWQLIAQRKGDC